MDLIPSNNQNIILAGENPLDTNPAAVYLASLQSETGRRTQRQALETMAGMLSGGTVSAFDFPWASLRYQHAQALRTQLISRYKPATVNKFLSALRGVLKQAWRLGQLSAEELARTTDLSAATGETLPAGRELSLGEITALLASCEADDSAAGARDAAIIALMYTCGLRRAEVAALDLADLDPESGRLVVRGKRAKERTAYLVGGAADAMADWLAVRGNDPGPLFWPVNKGGRFVNRRMVSQSIYDMLIKRAEEAGVKHFSPHDFRRTFVGDLLAAGADISTVSKMAGHANVATTARYDRRTEQAKQKAAGLLHVAYRKRRGPGV